MFNSVTEGLNMNQHKDSLIKNITNISLGLLVLTFICLIAAAN